MSCGCFVFIKEVVRNYLTSFIIKGVYYLTMAEPDVIDLRPPLISRIDGCKHLISRIWLAEATSQASVYFPLQDSVITMIHRVQQVDKLNKLIKKDQLGKRDSSGTALQTVDKEGLLRWRDRVYVLNNSALRIEILRLYHDDPLIRHFGTNKTMDFIYRHFY